MNLRNSLAALLLVSVLGGCAANASDRCEALDDALRTAFANVTQPTLVEVAVD